MGPLFLASLSQLWTNIRIFLSFLFSFFCAGKWIQSLVKANQVLCHWIILHAQSLTMQLHKVFCYSNRTKRQVYKQFLVLTKCDITPNCALNPFTLLSYGRGNGCLEDIGATHCVPFKGLLNFCIRRQQQFLRIDQMKLMTIKLNLNSTLKHAITIVFREFFFFFNYWVTSW